MSNLKIIAIGYQHFKVDKEVHHYEVLKKIKLHDFFHIPIKFLIHTKET